MKHTYKVDHHIGYRDFYDIFGYVDANRPGFMYQTCYLLRNAQFSYSVERALSNPASPSYELEELSSMAEIADMFHQGSVKS